MNETIFFISKSIGADLSSRVRAAALRAQIDTAAEKSLKSVLDFNGVRTLSDSFADELFGVLVVARGKSWCVEHIRIENARESVQASIREAIAERLGERANRRIRENA